MRKRIPVCATCKYCHISTTHNTTHKGHFEEAANTSGNDTSHQPPEFKTKCLLQRFNPSNVCCKYAFACLKQRCIDTLSNKIYRSRYSRLIDATKELLG